MPTTCQLTPFEVGQVKAHMAHGLGCTRISEMVLKPDGKSTFGETAIVNCMNKLKADPKWRGEHEDGSGAPRKTTAKEDKAITNWVLAQRGEMRVSVTAIKKQFPQLRALSDTLVEERLADAELVWLRRRRKPIVATKEYLKERVKFCQGVKRKHDMTLKRWAYTDGTVWYLDRSDAELQNTKRRALGSHVWRKSDNSDALWEECIGPSGYSKGQGLPIRIWGVLADGKLNIHVLEEGEVLNTEVYVELIDDHFQDWCGDCKYLVCDFEKSLRSDAAVNALRRLDIELVEDYPRSSQDFNAIENAWDTLKKRLDETLPVNLEARAEFVARLHAAARLVNTTRVGRLRYLSTNQKERARDCLKTKPRGGRTKW